MINYIRSIFLIFLFFHGSIAWSQEAVSLGSRNAGLFSIFFDVLDVLKSFDQGRFSGVEVDFQKEGHYYDPVVGSNWWSYYFEPINLGPQRKKTRVYGSSAYVNPYNIEFHTAREEAHRLIEQYIQIKPEIQQDIDDFESQEFDGYFVIGVHYRGTDKQSEAPRVPYQKVSDVLYSKIWQHRDQSVRIYVATDEQKFLNFLIASFGDMVCYYPGAVRSCNGRPLHRDPQHSPFRVGKEALIDCALLSRTDELIRTSSNLSLCSTFFNPKIPVIELNKRWKR